MKNIKAFIIILTGFLTLFFPIINFENVKNLSSLSNSQNILTNSINNDFFKLKNSGQLPESLFNSISNIELNSTSPEYQKIKADLSIKTKLDGKYILELTILEENPIEKNGRHLIQFSVYDKATKNLKWEKFRLYKR